MNAEECGGIHPIRKCAITSKTKQRKLLEKYWAQKKKQKKDVTISAIPSGEDPVPDKNDRRYAVTPNGIETVALGDSGAEFSTISKELFMEILEKHPETVQELHKDPMILEPAVKGGATNGNSTATS